MATDITPGLRWSASPTARQPTSRPANHKQPATYHTPRAHSSVSIATERLCASQRLAGDVESGGVWITETVKRQTQMWCRVGECVYILGAQPRALCRVWRPVSTKYIRPHSLVRRGNPDPTAPGSAEPDHLHNSDALTEPGCSDWSGQLITSNITGAESSRTLTFQFTVLLFRKEIWHVLLHLVWIKAEDIFQLTFEAVRFTRSRFWARFDSKIQDYKRQREVWAPCYVLDVNTVINSFTDETFLL